MGDSTSELPAPGAHVPVGGTVYTETVVYSAPEQLMAEAPYQIAIIDLDSGGRLTVRIAAGPGEERVRIEEL